MTKILTLLKIFAMAAEVQSGALSRDLIGRSKRDLIGPNNAGANWLKRRLSFLQNKHLFFPKNDGDSMSTILTFLAKQKMENTSGTENVAENLKKLAKMRPKNPKRGKNREKIRSTARRMNRFRSYHQ